MTMTMFLFLLFVSGLYKYTRERKNETKHRMNVLSIVTEAERKNAFFSATHSNTNVLHLTLNPSYNSQESSISESKKIWPYAIAYDEFQLRPNAGI